MVFIFILLYLFIQSGFTHHMACLCCACEIKNRRFFSVFCFISYFYPSHDFGRPVLANMAQGVIVGLQVGTAVGALTPRLLSRLPLERDEKAEWTLGGSSQLTL